MFEKFRFLMSTLKFKVQPSFSICFFFVCQRKQSVLLSIEKNIFFFIMKAKKQSVFAKQQIINSIVAKKTNSWKTQVARFPLKFYSNTAYLTCRFDCFAKCTTWWFAHEYMAYKFILCRVHDKCTIFHILSNTQKAQIAYSAFS